jgi:hypothetical protein
MFHSPKFHRLTGIVLALAIPTAAALADEAADPNWPCQQRLVPKISAAQLCAGELPPENAALTAPPELSELGRSVMSQSISDDQAAKLLTDFKAHLKNAKKFKQEAPTVFLAALFEANYQRTREISGIKKFTEGQFALSKKLAEDVGELDKLTQGQPAKEGTPAMDVENRVHLEQKVFEDREKEVPYLCEAPSIGEQRLGLVARVLGGAN